MGVYLLGVKLGLGRGADLQAIPERQHCHLWACFSDVFVFGSMATAPYGHGSDSQALKIITHTYFRGETSGIQNVFILKHSLIPVSVWRWLLPYSTEP